MWREIVSFNGSVFVLNVEINQWLNLHLSCFDYETDTSDFIATAQTSQQFKSIIIPRLGPSDPRCESRTSCLGFKVLLDHYCGIFLPFFVAQINDNLCYFFCLDSQTYKWVVKYSFEVPKQLGQTLHLSLANYSITNGPTIIWITGNEIFIYKGEWSIEESNVSVLRLSVSDMVANIGSDIQISGKILWWNCSNSGMDPDVYEHGLVVFKREDLSTVVSSYLVTLNCQKKATSITSTTSVIPLLYLSIITCSCIFFPSSSVTKDQSSKGKFIYKIYISTTQSQLVEFVEGQYVKHVNIPLPDCQTIEVFENLAGDLILLCSQEDQICAVDWKTSKILKVWSNFNILLADDFVGIGTNQVLLFSGNSKEHEKLFEDFILTDLLHDELLRTKGQAPDNVECIKDPDVPDKENSMDKVIYALNNKVKATEKSITECKMEKTEKSSFIKKHCIVLHDILMNRKCSFQTSGLASLLIGHDLTSDEGASSRTCSQLAVTAKWQDVCDRHWVVGLEIVNNGESTISDISLSLVNRNRGILLSHSKVFVTEQRHKHWNERRLNNDMPILLAGQKLGITTTTAIPDDTYQPHFSVGLMLSWKQRTEGCHFAQLCGEIILSVHDILTCEMRKPIIQSRLCQYLAISNLETQVTMSTRNTNTSSAIELLKSKMAACQCCSSAQSCEKYRPSASFLRDAHVSFASVGNDIIVTIFSRNCSQLCMTLYMLKSNLPDDLTWRPLRTQKLIDGAMKCVEEELAWIIEKLTNLLKVHRKKNIGNVEIPGENNEEISVKRRKLSQLYKNTVQREYDGSVDSSDYLKAFSDIVSHSFETEQTFQCFLLLWKTFE